MALCKHSAVFLCRSLDLLTACSREALRVKDTPTGHLKSLVFSGSSVANDLFGVAAKVGRQCGLQLRRIKHLDIGYLGFETNQPKCDPLEVLDCLHSLRAASEFHHMGLNMVRVVDLTYRCSCHHGTHLPACYKLASGQPQSQVSRHPLQPLTLPHTRGQFRG